MAPYTPGKINKPPGNSKGRGLVSRLVQKLRAGRRRTGPSEKRAISGMQRQHRVKTVTRGVVASAVLLLGGGGLIWTVATLVIHSDVFRLTDLNIRGNIRVATEDIAAAGGLEQGASLPALNLKKAEQGIRSLEWIERASISRQWPSTIEIFVKEQKPLALVNVEIGMGNELFYLNAKGEMFTALTPGQDIDFPVLTGIRYASAAESRRKLNSELEESALYLLKLAARGNAILPIQAISELYVGGDGLVMYLVDRPFPIYFGTDKVRTKYYRLVKILERLYRKKQMDGITAIRLDYTENKVLVARVDSDR